MAGGNIGGFFVNLGAKIDRASFNAADAALKGFESTAGKVTRALGFTTGSFLTMAKAAGAMETAELKAARAIGVSASKLNDWRISAGIAGTSGAALVGTMGQLEAKMQRLKLGQMDAGLAKNLGFLNINYDDFARMDANQRMRAVFNKADGMQDQRKAALLIQDTLGSAAREYYDYLKLSGKSLDQQLAEGRALNFTTEKSKREAMLFNAEINAVAQGAKSIATFLGSNIASKLTPVTIQIKGILINNRELIQSGIVGFVDRLASAITAFLGIASRITPLIVGLIDRFGGLDQVIIKIGLGIGALKLTRMVGDITSVIRSVGLLKTALGGIGAGLLATGLFLLLDDLAGYFSGKDSVTGMIMDNLDEMKSKLKDILPSVDVAGLTHSINDLAAAFKTLFIEMAKSESVKELFISLVDYIGGSLIGAFQTTVELFSNLINIIDALFNKDWSRAWTATKELGSDYWNGMKKTFHIRTETKPDAEMQDGIMRPDGTVTRVAPDDWVFAARNVEDMAAAFIPAGSTTNNSMHAPASYVINQNITVNGGNSPAAAVRQQAYNGASDAMLKAMNNSQRILQLMPGQR